ncbi:T9SS type A sorting domain-containing protein [Psychroserpens burtonensis]|uniref:T9SS type A sorting domain-containing protein n=1 Tax=Psychroserpens burtonensis TaxID=49278 RepID=UPI00048FF4A4|nr:T9SS type A sorting domain-containing protein [Psychroserpens burtonensis]
MTSPKSLYHVNGVQVYYLILTLLVAFLIPTTFYSQTDLAFPTASGAGAYATGGRGKPVYIVTNLNNSGSGSFRQALEDTKSTDGGIITFEVSGTINLTSQIYFTNQDNITIAGQTSPSGGITIANNRLRFQNVNNLIMRYIRVRPGFSPYPSSEIDAFEIFNSSNYIIDHCSFSWGTDENANSGNGNNYTWQRNLFAESNKTGMIMGGEPQISENLSFINNMFYNCSHRFPNFQSNGRVDVINNIVWNFRTRLSVPLGGFEANHINNYYVHFRSSPPADLDIRGMLWLPNTTNFPTIYTSGNYVSDVITDPNADNWQMWRFRFNPSGTIYSGVGNESPLTEDFRTLTPFTQLGNPFTIQSAAGAFEDIKYNVGVNARLLANGDAVEELDALDDLYLDNVQNNILDQYTQENVLNTSHRAAFLNTISSIPINTHPIDYDSDGDGMPDQWELNNYGNLNNNGQSDTNNSGYSDVEDYLNGVDIEMQNNTGTQVDVTSNLDAICQGSSTTLTASGADSYVWNTGETSTSIEISPDITTTYTVTGTHSDGSITQAEISITVNEIPTANAGQDIEICQGTEVILTATGGTAYLWNTGATSASINVNPNSTTMYTVEVFENSCSSTDEIIVTVNEIPNIDAGQDQTIFDGESATLTATGADFYLWSTGETTQTISVNPLLDTSYFVTGTTNNCENTDTVTVFLLDDSVNANAGADTEICNGESTTLTATGGTTYLWSTGETSASIIVVPTEITTYTVTAFSASGANFEDDSVIVTVNDLPETNAGNDISIIEGDSTTLIASGAASYIWSTGETTPSITVSPNNTTTYTVIGTSNGCDSSDDLIVSVEIENVNTNAGVDIVICNGESTILTASGGATYLWSTGETSSSITVNPNQTTTYTVTAFNTAATASNDDSVTVIINDLPETNAGNDILIIEGSSTTLIASGAESYVWNTGEITPSIIVSPISTTTYTVTGNSNGCESSDAVIVSVETENVNANAGADITICNGETTTLTASGGVLYLWSTGETTSTIEVSPVATTTYTVTAFSTNGIDSGVDSITVTVNEVPVADAGNDAAICFGNETILTASGGSTYLWNTGETSQSITVNPNVTTTYTVDVFTNNCSSSDAVIVTVNELPETNAGNDIIIIEGDSTTLTATGAESYIWSTGETTTSITVNPIVTTTYTVTGLSNECESIDDLVVTVEPFIYTASAGADQAICQGYETTLTASEGDSYLWSTGETTQSITVNPTNTQTYTVTVFDGAYQDDAEVQVGVNPNPNVIITNGDNIMILEGEFITLSAIGANTYSWNNGATQPNIAVSPSSTTTYEVTGFINNCEDTKAIIVNVLELVQADAGEDLFICDEETVTLTASGGGEYLWNNGETTQTIEVSPDEDTEYSVLVYNALDGDEDTVMVFVEECSSTVEIPVESEMFDFMIYQDPTSDILKVRIDGLQSVTARGYSIYDLSGKVIHTETFNPSEMEELSQMTRELDVSTYSRGVYVVRLIYDDTSLIKKIPIR